MKRTFEDIKKIAEKYEYLNDFRQGDMAAYVYARRYGWLDELFLKKKIVEPGTYTYEVCRDLAIGCKTRSEYHEKNKTAYRISLRNGWIDDFSWLAKPLPRRPRGFWTIERVKYALRVCWTYKELQERFPGARMAAIRYGIYHLLYDKQEPMKRTTDYERCLVEAIGYINEKEMREYSPKEHAMASKNGWIGEYDEFWNLKKRDDDTADDE